MSAAFITQAAAAAPMPRDPARIYVEARAAELKGDGARSATLFAALARQNDDPALTRKAISTAIEAGELALARHLATQVPAANLPIEAKLLLLAEELRRGRTGQAIAMASVQGGQANASFLVPLLRAWDAAERRDLPTALAALDSSPANGLLAPFRDEHRALILLRFKRAAEAAPFASRALGAAGGRRTRLRLVFADAFLRAGDRQRALAVFDGAGDPIAASQVRKGQRFKQQIDNAASGFSELLTALALDLSRGDKDMPVALLNVARYADPANSGAALLQGLILNVGGRADAALAIFRGIPANDALAADARHYEVQLLLAENRTQEALTVALPLATRRNASAEDFQRLGRVYRETKRFGDAAVWFGRAIEAIQTQGGGRAAWPMLYDRAVALEEAGRWEEAKADLRAALAVAPEEPALLNFLGYAKLERGEDLDGAEAMIRRASLLAPDEPAITDSLGWALFKRGRLPEAIETLQRAAAKDVSEPEIHEHLGDALYTAGRRYEARFAWSAALIAAQDDVARRLRAKLEAGLSAGNAAP